MTPPAIVRTARERGLDLIAVCDHNTAGNAGAAQAAAEAAGRSIAVLAGMEIATAEDIHVLGLFPDVGEAAAAGAEIRGGLPEDRGGRSGEQWILDRDGRLAGRETAMLAASSGLSLTAALAMIRRHRGLAIASHVDRPSFSVLSQLGVWPADAAFDAIEISMAGLAGGKEREFEALGLPMVTSSDSHFLSDIGNCRTLLQMARPEFAELVRALGRPLERRRSDE